MQRERKARSCIFFFVAFLFSLSILFVLLGRFVERVGLGLLFLFFGIDADRRRLNRVVAGVTLLETEANIDAAVLAAFRDGQSTGPSQRFDDIDGVADSLALTTVSVLLSVADDSAEPSGLLTRELSVLTDISEALASRVFTLELLNGSGLLLLW